jgi:hypothetical protein
MRLIKVKILFIAMEAYDIGQMMPKRAGLETHILVSMA